MNRHGLFLLTIVMILIVSGCLTNTETPDKPGYTDISVKEGKKLIESKDVFILDVRTQEEYDSGHINGSTLIAVQDIPKEELGEKLKIIPEDKDILVYCRSGRRSAQASQILIENGFSHVYNMQGGIMEWMKAGFDVVK